MSRQRRPVRSFHSILCPVDFSANSRAALRCGAALARRSHGSLTVLYVNDPLLVAAAAAAYDTRALARTSELELRQFVRKGLGAEAKAQPVTLAVAVGKPAQKIVRVAQQRRCDLIVMGTQGRSGPSKWFFGSVTQGVLTRATVPVLAIPARYRGVRAAAKGRARHGQTAMKTVGKSIARGLARRDRFEMRAVERAMSLLTPRTGSAAEFSRSSA